MRTIFLLVLLWFADRTWSRVGWWVCYLGSWVFRRSGREAGVKFG
jgi:hypothetical protein